MARKIKKGVDYFSHDVDTMQDKKIKFVKAKHGLISYAVYYRLLEEIYRDEGYFVVCDEMFITMFADDAGIPLENIHNMLTDMFSVGLFSKEKYEDFNILTSSRIQENYLEATLKRKEICLEEKYLVNVEIINVVINRVNVVINRIDSNISTQTKLDNNKLDQTTKAGHPSKKNNKQTKYLAHTTRTHERDGEKWEFDGAEGKTVNLNTGESIPF